MTADAELVNLTPHAIVIWDDDDPMGAKTCIPASGLVARLAVEEYGDPPAEYSADGGTLSELLEVPVVAVSYGHLELVRYGRPSAGVQEMPPESDGTWYVVSLPTALAVPRSDFLVPYLEVRNSEGTVLGCRGLARIVA